MRDPMLTDAPTPAQPQAGPQLYVGLEGVHVEFPAGYWDDPSHELRVGSGRTLRDERIDTLALLIASGLRKALAARRARAGLVGPDGRPLSA